MRLTALMCVAETLSMAGFACFTTLLPVLMQAWGLAFASIGIFGALAPLARRRYLRRGT